MKKISVIIPVYNVAQYIEKCINSVLSNEMDFNAIEIIVVDDESPDNSVEIVKRIAAQHPIIKLISQKNKGLGGARNTGIANATGEFILFLDADDWINPKMLEYLVDVASANDLDVLEFGAVGVTPDGGTTYTNSMSSDGKAYSGFEYAQKFNYMWSACNKIYRTQFLKQNELFFLEHIYYEDLEFFTRMIPFVKRMMAIPEIGASFYQSGDSITRNNSEAKKIKSYRDIVTIIERLHQAYSTRRPSNTKVQNSFYLQYLGTLVVTLFFQFIKHSENKKVVDNYIGELKDKNILYTRYKIEPQRKDLFRRIFLQNLMLFKLLMIVRRKTFKPQSS